MDYYKEQCESKDVSIQNANDLIEKNEQLSAKIAHLAEQCRILAEEKKGLELRVAQLEEETEMKEK